VSSKVGTSRARCNAARSTQHASLWPQDDVRVKRPTDSSLSAHVSGTDCGFCAPHFRYRRPITTLSPRQRGRGCQTQLLKRLFRGNFSRCTRMHPLCIPAVGGVGLSGENKAYDYLISASPSSDSNPTSLPNIALFVTKSCSTSPQRPPSIHISTFSWPHAGSEDQTAVRSTTLRG
jgi:hypothetical protein